MAPVQQGKGSTFQLHEQEKGWPILVCLLGGFRVLRNGVPAYIRPGGKTHGLLQMLALRPRHFIARETLLDHLWPDSSPSHASESISSLLYSLHKTLGECIGGAAPVVRGEEGYRLNIEVGVGVDAMCFDECVEAGSQKLHAGDKDAAIALFQRATEWYKGDLCSGDEVEAIVERERLRTRFLDLLAFLAGHYLDQKEYTASTNYAMKMLSKDPCREDAHRLLMLCYVRQGARTQAMRQYRLCQQILRAEFDTEPEQATAFLFEQIRLDRSSL